MVQSCEVVAEIPGQSPVVCVGFLKEQELFQQGNSNPCRSSDSLLVTQG